MRFNFYAFVAFLLREGSSCSRFQAYNRVVWFCPDWLDQLLWRNWLAHSAANRNVGGSSPAWSECVLIFTPLLRSFYVKVLPVLGSRPTTV